MGQRDLLTKQSDDLKTRLVDLEKQLQKLNEAVSFMEQLADKGQKDMIALIEKIASVGMSEVFGMDIKLKALVREQRGAQGLKLNLEIDGLSRSFEQVGGGLIDVLSFVLQVAVVKLVGAAPILFLDEPFKHVSKNYLQRISQLVGSLSELMGIQIVIVTHETQLIAGDRVYRFTHENGETKITDESDD